MNTLEATILFMPPDLNEAHKAWKCNCGPGSVAALLGLTCEQVRPHFPGHAERGYSNPSHLQNALRSLGCRVVSTWKRTPEALALPRFGIVFVQFGGPWLREGVPAGWAYRATHFAAVNGGQVYDVNQDPPWYPKSGWESDLLPWLASTINRCDGTFYIRAAFEVLR